MQKLYVVQTTIQHLNKWHEILQLDCILKNQTFISRKVFTIVSNYEQKTCFLFHLLVRFTDGEFLSRSKTFPYIEYGTHLEYF